MRRIQPRRCVGHHRGLAGLQLAEGVPALRPFVVASTCTALSSISHELTSINTMMSYVGPRLTANSIAGPGSASCPYIRLLSLWVRRLGCVVCRLWRRADGRLKRRRRTASLRRRKQRSRRLWQRALPMRTPSRHWLSQSRRYPTAAAHLRPEQRNARMTAKHRAATRSLQVG